MTTTHPSPEPAGSGSDTPRSSRRRNPVVHRRVLMLFVAAVVVAIGVFTNYGPVRAYHDARARLERTATAVVELQEEKAGLQAQLGKLTEMGHLQSLAREELAVTRPGEELYIVTEPDGDDGAVGDDPAAGDEDGANDDPAHEPGFFERMTNAILGLF